MTLDLLSQTDMEVRCNQEYFPDRLQAEAMVSAVTSLLKKNGWTTAVLGPCCSTATSWCPEAPQKAEEAPQKGHAVLEEATADKD